MKYSFYINSKSALDKLRILLKRIGNTDDSHLINSISELYIDSKLLFSNINDEKVFVNIFKIGKNINIIPHSQLLYYQFSEEEFIEDDPTNQLQQKIDYLHNFYEENEDDGEIYYHFSNYSNSRYSTFYNDILEKINTDPSVSRSSLFRFFDIELPQRIQLSKKISPFIFLEDSHHPNVQNFDDFFDTYENIDREFNTFLLYSPLEYIKKINSFHNREKLSDFEKIILWLPDFNEISAKIDEIRDLQSFLRDLYELNDNIIYLYGGMMIGEFFSDYIEEVICRKDIYPGYRIIPTKETFGRRKKNLFFPQFGRTTKLENIAAPPYRGFFECKCLSCLDYYDERGIFNKRDCLEQLEHSDTRKYYHNYHSFLLKLDSNEDIEKYPDQKLDNIKLGSKWRRALNE